MTQRYAEVVERVRVMNLGRSVSFVRSAAGGGAGDQPDRTGGAVLPVAALAGALLVLVADLAAGLLLAPTQLPVGIVTAVLGAPYFLFLLHRANKVGAGA